MSRYIIKENYIGKIKTLKLMDLLTDQSAEVSLLGGTLLNFYTLVDGKLFNIIDGFQNSEELLAARGARSWIMTPFANRIPEGKYTFNNKDYKLTPLAPRDNVIHGFTSYHNFSLTGKVQEDDYAELELTTNISPNQYEGYPFDVTVKIKYKFTGTKMSITVTGINNGNEPAPFWSGWHPYFKASEKGIDNLVLTIDAESVIEMDENFVPLQGNDAFGDLNKYPEKNYNSSLALEKRKIKGRTLDVCYAGLKFDKDGFAESSIFNPKNSLKVTMFQKGGYMLAFSGNSLKQRSRESVALEPMQFLTNSYNRPEFEKELSLNPGEEKEFNFGVKAEIIS